MKKLALVTILAVLLLVVSVTAATIQEMMAAGFTWHGPTTGYSEGYWVHPEDPTRKLPPDGRTPAGPAPVADPTPASAEPSTESSQTVTLQTPNKKIADDTCVVIKSCGGNDGLAQTLLKSLASPYPKFISPFTKPTTTPTPGGSASSLNCVPIGKQNKVENNKKIIINLWDPSCGMELPLCKGDASNYGVVKVETTEGTKEKIDYVYTDGVGTYFQGAGYYIHCADYDKVNGEYASESILVVGGHKDALKLAAEELLAGLKSGSLTSKIEYKMTEDWAKTAIVAFNEDKELVAELTNSDKATVIIGGEGLGRFAELFTKLGTGSSLLVLTSAEPAFKKLKGSDTTIDNLAYNLFALLNQNEKQILPAKLYGCKNGKDTLQKTDEFLVDTSKLYPNQDNGTVFVVKDDNKYYAGKYGVLCTFTQGEDANCEAEIQGTENNNVCAHGKVQGNFGEYGIRDSESHANVDFISGLLPCATYKLKTASIEKNQELPLCSELLKDGYKCPTDENSGSIPLEAQEPPCACIEPEEITAWKTVPQLTVVAGTPKITIPAKDTDKDKDKDKVDKDSKKSSRGDNSALSQTLQSLAGMTTKSGSDKNSTTTTQDKDTDTTKTESDDTGSSVTNTDTDSSAETSSGSSVKKDSGKVTVSDGDSEIEVTKNGILLEDGGNVQIKDENGVVTDLESVPPGGSLTLDPGESAELTLDNGDLVNIDSTGTITIWTPDDSIVASLDGPVELYGNGYNAVANNDGTSTVTNYGSPSFTANYASASAEPKKLWVLDENGAPIQDAKVYVSADGKSYSDLGETDANGQLTNPFLYDEDNAGLVYLAISGDDRAYGFTADANLDYDIYFT